jgi:hypothetical protein
MRDTQRRHNKHSSHLRRSLPPRDERSGDLAPLDVVELLAPSADPSLRPGSGKAGRRALADHGSCELREGTNHLHHHSPRWRGGIDVLGDETEGSPDLAELLHDVQ